MKIIKKGFGFTYTFKCPRCGSELEADEKEIEVRPHYRDIWFDCPACWEKRCCIALSSAIKQVKYAIE